MLQPCWSFKSSIIPCSFWPWDLCTCYLIVPPPAPHFFIEPNCHFASVQTQTLQRCFFWPLQSRWGVPVICPNYTTAYFAIIMTYPSLCNYFISPKVHVTLHVYETIYIACCIHDFTILLLPFTELYYSRKLLIRKIKVINNSIVDSGIFLKDPPTLLKFLFIYFYWF